VRWVGKGLLFFLLSAGATAFLLHQEADSPTTHHLSLRSEISLEGSGQAIATRAVAFVAAKTGRDQLEAELLATKKSDLLAARPRLEKLLRDRPDLAPGVARAWKKLDDREELFVLSRALVLCAKDSEVRATLVDAASGGRPAQRETALLALSSARDEATPELARAALEDAAAAPTVRAAGAWALAADPEHAPADTLATARALGSSTSEDGHLRAEALKLLATTPEPADRALALNVLSEPGATPEVALAAARLALHAGEDRTRVARALAARRDPTGLCARAAQALAEGREAVRALGGEP
jgi:hypothetical protein